MTTEQAEILNRLFEDGYIIHINTPGFEVSNVKMIEEVESDRPNSEDEFDYLYSDDTMSEVPLDTIDISQVTVSARMDWLSLLPSDQYKETFGMDALQSLQDWNDDLDKVYGF